MQLSSPKNSLRSSIAASAARTLVTSLPYAIENHSGVDIEFVVHGGDDSGRCSCDSGSIQYFRFDPPSGSGSGGERLYGQDMTFEKAVSLCIGDSSVKLSSLDSRIGFPREVLELADQMLIVSIQKEGKTVVSICKSNVVDLAPRVYGVYIVSH